MQSTLLHSTALVWGGFGVFCGIQIYQGNPGFYSKFLMPHFHSLCNPERSHTFAVKLLSMGLVPRCRTKDDEILTATVFGKTFSNPIGIAAGFDKHAEAMVGLEKIGFGFVEVGSITPLPQEGNRKPRVFRLSEDKAIINRCGFNSCGHQVVANRLERYKSGNHKIVLGVNLGKNKTSKNAVDDYTEGVRTLGGFADYIVINVSSPNTPGLRKLQQGDQLEHICTSVLKARDKLPNKPPILVKIAPDIVDKDKVEISRVITKNYVDGLIVCNTTVQRPDDLTSKFKNEKGGLSGKPLHEISTQLIGDMYQLTNGKIPIIGVGGVSNGHDAYQKIRAGASLVQLYTGLVYEGPPLVGAVKDQLTVLLKRDGFSNISEAVGADHR